MTVHIQLDLPAIEQAPSASGACGIGFRDHLAGLVLMFHHVWAKKSDQASPELLMGWFAVGPDQVPRLVAGLIAFGHLEVRGVGWRIKGASRYVNLRKAFAEGGKKTQAAFRARGEQPASTSSSESGPGAPSTPAGKKSRELSDQEHCWDVLERLRIEHCERLGLPASSSGPRPKWCNARFLKAVDGAGIVDRIIGSGETFSRWDLLTLLFERYLEQERIGLKDEEGKACTPPWPIPLFLAAGVLERFKQDYDAEEAA